MKKNVIAVMLSIVMAMGSIGGAPVLAAETTVIENEAAEELNRQNRAADYSEDALNSNEDAAQEQIADEADTEEEFNELTDPSAAASETIDRSGSADEAEEAEAGDSGSEAEDPMTPDAAQPAEGSGTAAAQPAEGPGTDAPAQSDDPADDPADTTADDPAAPAAAQPADQTPPTADADRQRTFQEKVMAWKYEDRILIACDSSDDLQIGYSIYPLESDELLQSGTLQWSESSGLYYEDITLEALNGLPVKIVLTDGTYQYEEIVSDDVGSVKFSSEKFSSEESSSEEFSSEESSSEESSSEEFSSEESSSEEFSSEEFSSEESALEDTGHSERTATLYWNNIDYADGYNVIMRLADDSVKVYETTENHIELHYSADDASGVTAADAIAADTINESGGNATNVTGITVAAYRYDPATGRKFFGEAAFIDVSDAAGDAAANGDAAGDAAANGDAAADATDATADAAANGDAAADATTDVTTLLTEEIPGGLAGQNAAKADAEAPTEGTCGENLTWKLESSGTLRISGTGEMANYQSYSPNQAPWYESKSSIKSIVVEEGVTSIGNYAFYNCDATGEISLPNSLVRIGNDSFRYSSGPSVLKLPENLKEIGSSAFFGMEGPVRFNVPDSVTSLGYSAFKYCFDLETATLGSGIKSIPSHAFEGVKKLKGVSTRGKIYSIGEQAFYGCTALERFDVPDGVATLYKEAFRMCTALKTVTLPDSLLEIYKDAFIGCTALEQITIPDSVTEIRESAFMDCTSLKKATLSSGMKEIPTALFKNCSNLSQVTIPDAVEIIGKQAFYGCESLAEITLPARLKYIDDEAFMYCTKLSKVIVPNREYEAGQDVFGACADDLQLYDRDMQLVTDADMGDATATVSDNKGDQTYSTYGTVTNSYLVDEGDRRLRIEFSDGKLIREYFDTSGNLLSRKSIPVELPLFGGFMEGKDGYYLLFGQENEEEDDSKEVYRVVRYSKSWARQGVASIRGENTAIPFDGGSASMTESGGVLYLRTCHEMYDGHQANLTAAIRESDMSVTWIYSDTGSNSGGFVSHSFNQIIKIDGNDVIAVDHGDYNPRGVILFRYAGQAGAESLGRASYVNVFPFVGGGNYTGASIGALESSPSHYLIAGNSQEQVVNSDNIVRNIFVTATSKSDFSNSGTTVHWVTSYSGKEKKVSTPVMTSLPDGRCLLMWTVDDVLNYCFVGADGTPENKIYTGNGALSDCQPYVKDNAVWWYVTNSTSPVYYYISLDAPGQVHAENEGHTLVLDPTGGSLDSTSMEVKHGSTYGDLPAPDRGPGYEFTGWYTRKNYGTKITSETVVRVCNSETLYAHWKLIWSFSEETGTLTVNDTKVLSDNWDSIAGQVTRIIVGDDVYFLGSRYFDSFPEVTEVIIPDSVNYISSGVFGGTKTQDIYFIGTEERWNSIVHGDYSSKNIVFVDDIYDLKYASIDSLPDAAYTGAAIKPEPTVVQLGSLLAKDSDYTLSYSKNTAVGTATVTITGKGKYRGSTNVSFKITQASIAKAKVSGLTDAVYTGQAITQAPTVKLGTKTLKAGTDYTVSYANNVAVGTATVTVTGKGNYVGTVTGTFKITPVSIEGATVTGIKNKTYTGKAITQAPTVQLSSASSSVTLKSGTDYTLSYTNNTAVGTATVKITGKGNYSGTISKTFKITAASIESAEVSGVVDKVYTGQAVTQALTVKRGGVTLKSGTDYTVSYTNNTAVGTASMTITGKGNFSGTVSKTFKITAASIESATVTGIKNKTYTGKAITQSPTVQLSGVTLKSGTDYTVSYSNNTAVGTATVKITGKGNYSGTISKTFKITAASIESAEISGVVDKVYTGQAVTQALTVKWGSVTLKEGTDYTVSYLNNTVVGTATVTVTGKGNFKDAISQTFEITPAPIEGATVTGIKNKTYTGKAITQAPTVQLSSASSSVTLKSGTDYTLSYTNNTAVGTATVKITGKGNYTGTISKTFKITAASIESAEISGVVDKVYTGKAVTQALTVKWGSVTLKEETDYTVSYTNNTVVGTATVTITGKGNYKGTVSKTFKITPASIAKAKVSGLTDAVYTGQAITQAPTVKLGTKTLKAGTDYTVSYADNTAAGTATVKITGKGNYSGTVTGTFKITPVSIESATVTGIKNKTYTGKAIKQSPVVKVGDITLKSGTDYTLSYANNTVVGTATVTITGKGNYSGTISKTFKITAASIESAEVSGVADQVYTGNAVTLPLTVQLGSVTLKSGTDYTLSYANNTAVGTATVTITGKGNYKGTVSKTFEITRVSIEGATVTGIKNKTYTGKAVKQSPVVKMGETTLKSGTDYKIAYSDNVNVGTATVTITGTGSYNGKIVRTFKIAAKSITPAVELSETVFTYNGRTQKPDVIVKDGEKVLSDADYDIVWADDCVGAGVHELTVTLKGNYAGTETETFTILPGKTSRGDMFNLAGNVKVTWKEVPGAVYYKVYREGITDPSESVDEPVIVTTGLIGWDKQPGLTNGNAYRYRIVASLTGRDDPSGDSTLSYSKVMYRLKTVVIRSVKNTEPGKVTVKYDKTTSGDSYVLQYGEREDMVGAKTKVVLGADNTSYVIGGLTKGKTYYISIRVRKKVDGIDYYTTFGVPKKVTITK